MKIASWSKNYYEGLTEAQHKVNDEWFESKRKLLNYTGVLIVPNLQKTFNKDLTKSTYLGCSLYKLLIIF